MFQQKYTWWLIIAIIITNECFGAEHGLEKDVDQLIQDELGDDPFSRRLTAEDYKKLEETNTTQEYNLTNETVMQNATDGPEKNINGTEIMFQIKKLEIDRLLNLTTNRLEEFKNNVDVFDDLHYKARKHEPTINGRRTSENNNLLLETMLLDAEDVMHNIAAAARPPTEPLAQKPALRYYYYYSTLMLYTPKEVHTRMRYKIMNMMYTHLYRAQYYVTFAQQMRKRYIHHVRYKLGFCFALARQLYQEQRILMQGLWYNFYGTKLFHGLQISWALLTFEKIQRLQRDIRDINHHIKALEYERKMTEDPDYYKFLPSSTGRYSG